jgi:ribosomal protein S6
MPMYETLCILHPELPDARVKELSPPAALKELERNLRINEHVLRYLSTVYTAPPAPLQAAASVPSTPAPSAAPAGDEAGQQ